MGWAYSPFTHLTNVVNDHFALILVPPRTKPGGCLTTTICMHIITKLGKEGYVGVRGIQIHGGVRMGLVAVTSAFGFCVSFQQLKQYLAGTLCRQLMDAFVLWYLSLSEERLDRIGDDGLDLG